MILQEPSGLVGKTYHLTGPVSQDMHAVASEFTEALGRTIKYVDVPGEVFRKQLGCVLICGRPARCKRFLKKIGT
ncbi:uncharacterized protein YbjT (DUF2867 family) [Bradyrhizobium japonicum]|uniref:Uncharacterized protein YbjT (DUF2867 family) n=1 Tax=Bradyrhizobium japonicum TaxID=375 RepID=A0ABV2RWW9_BRAJP